MTPTQRAMLVTHLEDELETFDCMPPSLQAARQPWHDALHAGFEVLTPEAERQRLLGAVVLKALEVEGPHGVMSAIAQFMRAEKKAKQ